MTTALQKVQAQLADMATNLGQVIEEEQYASRRQANGQAVPSPPTSSPREDALIGEHKNPGA